MQTHEPWPYSLPIFARAHRAISPNGKMVAEIVRADEGSMSLPLDDQAERGWSSL
jgi:hypothetical protein